MTALATVKARKPLWQPHKGAQQFAWERMDVDQLFFGGGRGCVHPDTLLDTPSGKVKIKDWKGGEIYSYREGKIITTFATESVEYDEQDLFEVVLEHGHSVICTDEHKFLTPLGWKMLKEISPRSCVLISFEVEDDDGVFLGYTPIESIKFHSRLKYWDLHIPETNCYFANGILHHNSGKSSFLIGTALTQWEMYRSSARFLILRRQFRDLREIIRQSKEILCLNGKIATYNASEHVFYGRGRYEGATLELGNLERMDDYGRYHGNAYSGIGFDELTEFQDWEMVDRMGSTLRSKDPKVKCIMRFTGNPGGRLHQEVKRRFYDPAPKGSRLLITPSGQTRMMVHSTVRDNPSLFLNDPGYMIWLESLPPVLRKAWYEGCWELSIGSFFGDLWDEKRHIIPRLSAKDIPASWEIRRAFDWGSSTPFCCLWYTISDGNPMENGFYFPRGAMIFLWELYGQNPDSGKINDGMRLSDPEVAAMIKRREIDLHIHERVTAGPADNQIFDDTRGKDSSLYKAFEKIGVYFLHSNKSSNVAGWQQVRNRLKGENGKPMMYFTEFCTNSIRTIPALVNHPTKIDDIADGQENHCGDVAKYASTHHPMGVITKKWGPPPSPTRLRSF